MRTLIIGGGKGCHSLLGLATGSFLKELTLDVQIVVDVNPNAEGMVYARSIGLKTFTTFDEGLADFKDPELIIELTGKDETLDKIYKKIPKGVRVIDHKIARLFWDIHAAREEQDRHLAELDALERKLEKERRFLQSIFDNSADLSAVVDIEGRIVRANSKFLEYTGLEAAAIKGMTSFDALKHTELSCDPNELSAIFSRLITTKTSQITVKRTYNPEEIHWEITRTPIIGENGDIDFILIAWHKITDKVMLKREIQSAEQRFVSFINSAKDWISIKDLDGRYAVVNPVTASAFHLQPIDFIGKLPQEIFPGKLAKTINIHDNEVIEKRIPITYEEIIPYDNVDHHFQTVRFPLFDYKDEIIGVCTIARDVTKEVKLQDQLIHSEKLAALGKLAAGVAHEINNPLTGILAYAEDLKDEFPDNINYREDLEVIIRETLRCRDIVRNLLDFAKQDTPKLELMHPNDIVGHTLRLVKRLPQFKDIQLEINLSEQLPHVNSDLQQMTQVILNLMINAADAMKYRGKIAISTTLDKNNNVCIISVEDDGPGIPENLIDKVFEPFFSTKGTNGLGLAVSWGIIERHGGNMEIDISKTGGAVFNLRLPVVSG